MNHTHKGNVLGCRAEAARSLGLRRPQQQLTNVKTLVLEKLKNTDQQWQLICGYRFTWRFDGLHSERKTRKQAISMQRVWISSQTRSIMGIIKTDWWSVRRNLKTFSWQLLSHNWQSLIAKTHIIVIIITIMHFLKTHKKEILLLAPCGVFLKDGRSRKVTFSDSAGSEMKCVMSPTNNDYALALHSFAVCILHSHVSIH